MTVETHPVDLHILQQFDLVALAKPGEEPDRLVPRHLFAHERQTGGDNLRHLGLDLREIIGRKRLVPVEVVVETVLDGRTDGNLHLVAVQFPDGQGHDMGGGMTENFEAGLGRHRHRLQDSVFGKGRGQFKQPAVTPDSYGFFPLLSGNKRLQRIRHHSALRKRLYFAIL